MVKNLDKTRGRDSENATRVARTAALCGVSVQWVRKVIRGDASDEKVLKVFMELQEGENALLEEVQKLVPFI